MVCLPPLETLTSVVFICVICIYLFICLFFIYLFLVEGNTKKILLKVQAIDYLN